MATVNKDFKIKYGLVVEGSTATVNGYDILTKKSADQNYIIGLIGGSSDSANTPNTVVKRDGSGNFAAGTITADLTGDVTGTVSDISNHDTGDLTEGSNLYYTDQRVKNVLTGSTQSNIQISEIGGVLHITAENGVADSTTDDLNEGTTNKYFTDSRARLALSEGTGINYNNSTGQISADLGDFDTDDLVEGASNKYFTTQRIDDHLIGGDGINYSAGTISADVAGGLEITAGQIVVDRDTVDAWYDASGSASTVQGNLDTHTQSSSAHGVTGNIVGTTDTQTLSNKTIDGALDFGTSGSAITDASGDLTVTGNGDLTLTTNTGDIVLNPDGLAYIGSASAGNEIATNAYVDNAVSGLTWKQSVNVLAVSNVALTGSTPLSVDSHTLSDGYRVLLTGQSTNSENGIYDLSITGGSYALTRSADADVYGELVGAAVFVMEGTLYNNTSWVQSNHYLADFTSQSWTQFSGSGSVVAGTGITVDGLEVSVDRTTVDTWYDYNGAAVDEVSDHNITSGVHGVTGNIVGTSDTQTLTNKTIDASNNSISNIANSSLTNDSITVNGYETALGSSVTLDTDDVSEGSNLYFTQSRARQSLTSGTAISYDNTTGTISVDATQLDTDDITEGTSNKYYTDARVKNVLTTSTQNNISITEVAGELIITAENGVADSTTDDLDEGTYNHYFTDERAKTAAADLLTSATKTNITITGTGAGLTITAENGVADSTTDDLDEGSTNLYFTDSRAVDAITNANIYPTMVDINDYRREEATQTYFANASTGTVHSFAYPYGSVKYVIRVVGNVGGTVHSQITEILATVDGNNNVAVTEFGSIHTTEPALATFTVDYDGVSAFRLRATTANNGSEVIVAATMLSWAD